MGYNEEYTVTLPIAFASACYVAFTQSAQTGATLVLSKTTKTLKLIKKEHVGDVYWMAVGK